MRNQKSLMFLIRAGLGTGYAKPLSAPLTAKRLGIACHNVFFHTREGTMPEHVAVEVKRKVKAAALEAAQIHEERGGDEAARRLRDWVRSIEI